MAKTKQEEQTTTGRKGIRSLFRRKKNVKKDETGVEPESPTVEENEMLPEQATSNKENPEMLVKDEPKMEQAKARRQGFKGLFQRGNRKAARASTPPIEKESKEDNEEEEDQREPAPADERQEERDTQPEEEPEPEPEPPQQTMTAGGGEQSLAEANAGATTAGNTTDTITTAPSARESAFSGPPRYDWIDIETNAAIKLQSAFRRNKALDQLEKQGKSTAAIRNRARRREAHQKGRSLAASSDVPNLFACCGVGLAFGDATDAEYDAIRDLDKVHYHQQKLEQQKHEAQLRSEYGKMKLAKKYGNPQTEEVYEVVE